MRKQAQIEVILQNVWPVGNIEIMKDKKRMRKSLGLKKKQRRSEKSMECGTLNWIHIQKIFTWIIDKIWNIIAYMLIS